MKTLQEHRVLEILQQADRPLTVKEIAERVPTSEGRVKDILRGLTVMPYDTNPQVTKIKTHPRTFELMPNVAVTLLEEQTQEVLKKDRRIAELEAALQGLIRGAQLLLANK